MMLHTVRVLTVALVAVMISCADAGQVVAPAPEATRSSVVSDERTAERLDALLDDVALYLPGQEPRGPMHASAVIGPDGGALRLGDFELVVPAGAVALPRRFEIRLPPEPSRRRHAAVWFGPHNQAFAVPVTIRLPLARTESAGAPQTPVLWWNGRGWTQLVTQPTADGRIETQTSHFSFYATASRRGFTTVGG